MKHEKLEAVLKKGLIVFCVVFISLLFFNNQAMATTITPPDVPETPASQTTEEDEDALSEDVVEPLNLSLSVNGEDGTLSGTLQMLLVLTVISLAPSILVMMTSFTRIIVVMHFVRTAMGLTSSPPNNVLIGLSLFLTLFIMAPTFDQVNKTALEPYSKGEMTQEEAIEAAMEPMREFMIKQVREEDVKLFLDISGTEMVSDWSEIKTEVLIPAFIISELRAAFIIGFLIYIPFIIIDMVVASTLMSMGMMMLPPTTISMPFKVLLFIMADGWNLLVGQLVQSFVL